jgi:hypothetical protein
MWGRGQGPSFRQAREAWVWGCAPPSLQRIHPVRYRWSGSGLCCVRVDEVVMAGGHERTLKFPSGGGLSWIMAAKEPPT